tara:strand:- start:307 stop:1071 length:765 start_codon:yes stop_codon:yes gene_type:complete
MMSLPLINYTLKAARRDRLIWIMTVTFALSVCMSLFMSSAVVTEKEIFAVVFMGGSMRLFAVIGIVLFVCFYVRRLFENREIEYLLSRPISRTGFVLSNAFALSAVALFFALCAALAVGLAVYEPFSLSFALWCFSFIVELLVVVHAALFFSMVITSAAGSALATMGFYVFARMMGQLLGISHSGVDLPGGELLNGVFTFISMFIPRLDLLTQTSWLVYGVQDVQACVLSIAHGLVIIPVLLFAAIFDLVRREF